MQHYDVLWTKMKTQKSKRWQDGARNPPRAPNSFDALQSDAAAGTATFDQQSSVMAVYTEDGMALGSKAVASPEIGSEFEFEEFLVTVEGARSAPLDDVTNHFLQPPPVALNPPKFHKHVHQQHQQQQDASPPSASATDGDCNNAKFLVAYTRCAPCVNVRSNAPALF